MGKPFKVEMIADVGRFISSIRSAMNPLEAVGEALEDLSRVSERSATDSEDALEGIGDMARMTGEDLERLAKEARDSGRKIGDSIEGAAEEAEDSMRTFGRKTDEVLENLKKKSEEFDSSFSRGKRQAAEDAASTFSSVKEEALDSGREAATSFTGEIEDVTDWVRDILANSFQGLGTIGTVAGIAAAAGLGVLVSAVQKIRDQAEKAREKFVEMGEALASGDIKDWSDYVGEAIKEIATGGEDAVISLEDMRKMMNRLGDDSEEMQKLLMRAWAGDTEAMDDVIAKMEEVRQARKDAMSEGARGQAQRPIVELDAWIERLEEERDKATEAKRAAELYGEAITESEESIRGSSEALEAQNELLEEEADLRAELAENNRSYAKILADQKEELAAVNQQIAENNANITDSTDLHIANEAALAELADGLIAEAEAAAEAGVKGEELSRISRDNYDDFLATARAAGITGKAAEDLARRFGLIPESVKTSFTTSGVGTALGHARDVRRAVAEVPRDIPIGFRVTTGDLMNEVARAVRNVGVVRIPATANIRNMVQG